MDDQNTGSIPAGYMQDSSGRLVLRDFVKPADLLAADAVWLIYSIRLLAPVTHIDGTGIGNPDVRARLTAELDALLAGTE